MSDLAQSKIATRLRAMTPARVGLGRTGVSLETREVLEFQLDHARARDAVHAHLDAASLAVSLEELTRGPILRLHSAARDRAEYLQRPDLGRRLTDASRALLTERSAVSTDIALILADGLSALAVVRHAARLIEELLPMLPGLTFAPLCIVEQGRVAIGDEIGQALGAQIAVVLIGERPGLSSADSLGVYVTWQPCVGRTDAERVCISNIRAEGLSYKSAAEQLARVLKDARRNRLTGVASVQGTHQETRAISDSTGEQA